MSKSLMIQGTSSDAGKSLIVAGLGRVFKRKGINVCPFKAQNMALNSYVTKYGLELGRAQALQAVGCKLEPEIDFNPVLLKPEGNSRSQVVVMGKPWKRQEASDYFTSKRELWPFVTESLDRLKKKYDLIICEGAGSPAEINLKDKEIVNMAVAKYLNSPVFLVGDINPGGVFAFLYGTLKILPEDEQELIKGFIINKFRGDISLLEPGYKMFEPMVDNRPILGTLPYIMDLMLPQEDSLFLEKNYRLGKGEVDIAVIAFPHLSNYDDLDALILEEGVQLRFVKSRSALGNPDAVILPGSKTTISDLKWVKDNGLDKAIYEYISDGGSVVGICGGYQMMGKAIKDPQMVESCVSEIESLQLFQFTTIFQEDKKLELTNYYPNTKKSWLKDFNSYVDGYQIHMGKTIHPDNFKSYLFKDSNGDPAGVISEDGRIWGCYLHGIFNKPDLRRKWLTSLGWKARGEALSMKDKQESELNRFADILEENLDIEKIEEIIGL